MTQTKWPPGFSERFTLFDREKAPAIQKLKGIIECRLLDAPDPSPYRESLEAQRRAAENALNVILA